MLDLPVQGALSLQRRCTGLERRTQFFPKRIFLLFEEFEQGSASWVLCGLRVLGSAASIPLEGSSKVKESVNLQLEVGNVGDSNACHWVIVNTPACRKCRVMIFQVVSSDQ